MLNKTCLKISLMVFMLLGGTIVLSCSSSNSSTSSSGNTASVMNAITIDNAGTVPVINGGTTSSVIYVHNNSNVPIHGISYTSALNTTNPEAVFLNSNSTKLCSSIAAFQSCPLAFTTPPASSYTIQGAALITASYVANGKAANFSQILNFQNISVINEGVNFSSGVDISGFNHNTGYATVYIYGGGTNEIYTVNRLDSNKPAVTISNGNVTGQQIASGYVQAVEITSPIAVNPISAILTVISTRSETQRQFISVSSATVNPVASGGILIAGQVPVINTAGVSNPGGSLIITNAGNAAVTLGSSNATVSGITNLSGCTSGSTLAVGASCTITFNVTQSTGSGAITLDYTGGSSASSISGAIAWYNSTNGALVNMSYATPMSFLQTISQQNQVTITNIGGYNLTGLTVPTPQVLGAGQAVVTISYPASNSCQNATLNIGQSCNYYLNIVDAAVETNKQILFGINGNYNNGSAQTYLRYAMLTYSTISLSPTLTISPNPANLMSILGNNIESASQTLTISNSGNASATLTSQGIQSPYNTYFTTSNCTSPLESSA